MKIWHSFTTMMSSFVRKRTQIRGVNFQFCGVDHGGFRSSIGSTRTTTGSFCAVGGSSLMSVLVFECRPRQAMAEPVVAISSVVRPRAMQIVMLVLGARIASRRSRFIPLLSQANAVAG